MIETRYEQAISYLFPHILEIEQIKMSDDTKQTIREEETITKCKINNSVFLI